MVARNGRSMYPHPMSIVNKTVNTARVIKVEEKDEKEEEDI